MKRINLNVTQEVKSILPEVFIEYLWNLAFTRANPDSSLQVFTLISNHLGGSDVQDIIHQEEYQDCSKQYRIFGIIPVNQVIKICFNGNCYEMSIAS